jgi:hypothetical protein
MVVAADTPLARARAKQLRASPAKPSASSDNTHPTVRKRQIRSELHRALSRGLLDAEAEVDQVAGLPKAVKLGDFVSQFASNPALRRVHTSTHSPLMGHVADGRDLAFHLAQDIPAARRLKLRTALESRGWRVEYNLGTVTRLRQRGVIVLPDEAVDRRGARVIELEEAGVHVASIEQLLKLLKHPAGYTRTEEPPPSPPKPRAKRTGSSSTAAQSGSGLKRTPSRSRSSAASNDDASPTSRASGSPGSPAPRAGSPASQTQSPSSMSGGGGWPSWVLEVSESPSAEQLSPREAERLEVAQTAHEERIVVHARQATLRDAVLQGQLRRVKAALRDHPEDVRGKDEHGRSAFWLAVLAGEAELLEVLADAGADIEEEAADGATALFAACHAGNQEVVQALLDLGSNPEKISVSTMPHRISLAFLPSLPLSLSISLSRRSRRLIQVLRELTTVCWTR